MAIVLLAPPLVIAQPLLSRISRPLSSPGDFDELQEENHRLRMQTQSYKVLPLENSKQLIEKSESLIAYRST